MHEEFGNIFRFPNLPEQGNIIVIFNANDIENVFRNEGVYPERPSMLTLKYYRETVRPEIYAKAGSLITE